VLKVGATGLAVALAFLPRQRDPARMAALEAAVLIATSTVTSEPSLNVDGAPERVALLDWAVLGAVTERTLPVLPAGLSR
jgi:hypothetical protein